MNKDLLYGLVLAGGQSTRMKTDKSLIKYYNKSQVEHCAKLLSNCCEKVFISNRKDQKKLAEHNHYSQIHDQYENIGPIAGILSAMTEYPDAAWFVLACDLPFVNSNTLEALIQNRNQSKVATIYKSTNDGLPEPLCGIYEAHNLNHFKQFLDSGIHCPRKILIKSDTEMIEQEQKGLLDNINDQEEYQNTIAKLNKNEFSK